MKSTILLLLCLALFSACNECPQQRFTTSSSEINVAKALLEDYLSGDWDGWLSHYAPDAELYHNSTEGASAGEVAAALGEILANTSSYDFSEDPRFYEMIIDDDGVKWVYFWSDWSGRLKATGEELTIPVHLALHFEDGKIKKEYGYYDMSKYAMALQATSADTTGM